MHWMVWPKVKTKLKSNQVVKNKNAMIEKGRNNFSFVCSLFFIIKTPPKDARTRPSSRGWWDQEISPSIPNRSWDKESPNPEIIWIAEPAITSLIPVFSDPRTDFLSNNKHPMTAAKLVIKTPVYTTMWEGLQKNSGSLRIWDIASQNPAETITIGPITAKMDTKETIVVDFNSEKFENFWISFILFLR